jgi:UDP-N-acetylglucosamine--N-acetylmuramyl-(pentapeptide) pyrophosphoryl-undecaprenol N-acetylglucosamine transferase
MKSRSNLKILVVTGSTGGHIFPAVSFIESLKVKDPGVNVILVIPKRSIKYVIPPEIPVRYISITNINRGLTVSNFKSLFNFLKGGAESLILVATFKPDVAVGFGSISSFWVIFWSWIFRIKVLIHEQNVLPGEASKLLSNFADKIAISFPESRAYFKGREDKVSLTGNPLRRSLRRIDKGEARGFFGLGRDKFTVLVCGGSQGSAHINHSFVEGLREIDRSRVQVIHLSGEKDFADLEALYRGVNVEVKLFSFLENMEYAYSASDLAFTRAGAMTISELVFFNLPAVIIPYPYAKAHQSANARVLQVRSCAIIINDRDFTGSEAARIIKEFQGYPGKIQGMRSGFKDLYKDNADYALAQEALDLART